MSWLRSLIVLITVLVLGYGGYVLAAKWMTPANTFVQSGVASWYGREEQGKPTADGETFDRHDFTAASRHIPFNSVVRVTNQDNGRSVQVRINDRGPFVKGRIFDLSEAAANSLDMKKSGTAKVKIEMVEPASAEAEDSP